MRILSAAVLCLAALALSFGAQAASQYSYAQPDKVVVKHIDLDLALDFKHQRLSGSATLDLDWKDTHAHVLNLDTDNLDIKSVSAVAKNGATHPLDFTLAKHEKYLGRKLAIEAPKHPRRIRIDYATSRDAAGLQWLTAKQTADQKQPFMYSQSESTHARSWIPLQDTPAVRFTYTAHITAPKGVRVIMSAPNDPKHALDGEFDFKQTHPIPSYLMAIAAGDIAAISTGPRTAVYAEPSMVKKAAHEFDDTEEMIETAEKLYGPYRWGRYDILVLPPSFPYGGMENPNVTFATPTAIVGDKSLVSLIAHELAHSWSGNLVTAASWRDIWLNEGITTYVEGRIIEAVYGQRKFNEEVLLAARHLKKTIGEMPENSQRLKPKSRPVGADDSLSDVAYDKGSWFMRTLEAKFGRKHFDTWLKGYFDRHAWHSITTETMLADLKQHLFKQYPDKMRWDAVEDWVYGTGIPDDARLPDSKAFDKIDAERKAFLAGNLPADKLNAGDWNTQEWMYFLNRLPQKTSLKRIKALDAAWHLTGTSNAEIGMRWYRRAIVAGDKKVWPAAAEHMRRIGRLYLTMPLYRALTQVPGGLAYAKKVYAKAKAGYHPLTRRAVESLFAQSAKNKGSSHAD
jgi:aminopeptidase N